MQTPAHHQVPDCPITPLCSSRGISALYSVSLTRPPSVCFPYPHVSSHLFSEQNPTAHTPIVKTLATLTELTTLFCGAKLDGNLSYILLSDIILAVGPKSFLQ